MFESRTRPDLSSGKTGPKSIENRLLLACSRKSMTPAAVERARGDFALDPDWKYLVRQCQEHSVLPLFIHNLGLHFRDLVPGPVLSSLTSAAFLCQQRNLALIRELLRILTLFENGGIDAIPFKGPVLAVIAYGNAAFRTFADLDILVKEEDLSRARDLLIADGYHCELCFTPEEEVNYRRTECAIQFMNEGRHSVVELHWRLTERYLSIQLPIEDLWRRSRSTTIWRRTIRTLAPEDLVLYLCIHGSKHRWERLEWLCSLVDAVQSDPGLDWTAVADRAGSWGVERMLRVAALLARDLIEASLSEDLWVRAQTDAAARRLAEEAAGALFSRRASAVNEEAGRGDWYFYLLRLRERWSDKLRILTYTSMRMPHPQARELMKLPPSLYCLYYLLRPARLAAAALSAFSRHVSARVRPGRPAENSVTGTVT